jgi:S1-C subfamily serine protease
MKRVRICAAVLMLATPSYAWAQGAEGLLGRGLPDIRASAPKATAKGSGVTMRTGSRLAKGLSRVQPDGRASTRGAAEARVYQQASPAVVLILTKDGVGSGAMISADGQIITNAHVVGDEAEVGVVFKPTVEGAEVTKADMRMAKVLKRDEIADLALIKVDAPPAGVTPLKLGSLDSIQVGSDVNAIGHPTGESWTYTRGIVSQIRRDYAWTYEDDKVEHRASVIQTQTPINPGNSGGPLLDDSLQIVGVNSFTEEGEGLNFAVSVDEVKTFLARSGDRMAKPAVSKASKKKTCELRELGSSRSEKDHGLYTEFDADCDGKSDFLMFEPDDQKEGVSYFSDEDENGKIDTIIHDGDRDGNFDFALYDTDGDGESDVRGDYKNGEDEPYRLERIEKE